uniref:Replication-associated protein n=1 Tax=Cyanopica cyanus Genomoviridae sp. TaxID=2814944 RepID=A0A8E7G230_9VIRU
MPPFKFDGRYVLLTYAQSGDLDGGLVVEHLSRLHAECIVAREDHVDGGTHLHAFCDFGRRFRSRRTDVFDVGGRHPNISISYGSPDAGYDYAIKDGDVVGGGLERPSGVGVYEDESTWAVIHRSPDESSFWESVARLDPKTLCTNYRNLRAYVDWWYNTPQHEKYVHPRGLLFELGMVPELVGWRENSLGTTRGRGICRVRRHAWGYQLFPRLEGVDGGAGSGHSETIVQGS